MERFVSIVVDKRGAWAIVVLVAVLTVVCLGFAGQIQEENDLLAFLPQDNPDIERFQSINKEFGGLDAALIGIETDDVFDGAFLKRLKTVTRQLTDLPQLDHVISISNMQDFAPDPMGGIRTEMLIPTIPQTPAESAALKAQVMSRGIVVGSLISEDAGAVLLVAMSAYGADPQKLTEEIRGIVEPEFTDAKLYWGGSPFISTYIFQATKADLARLSPWAVVAIVFIMLLAFRDVVGTALGLVSTGIGILVSRALMAALGIPLNIVLGSMPIILFAVGSAYSIHILARYQSHALVHPCPEAVRRTLLGTGPTVLTAGLTTAVGMLSFAAMDIEPLRIFGVFTAVGILATLGLSLTFVPAVIRLVGLKGRQTGGSWFGPLLARLSMRVRAHRRVVGVLLAVIAVVGVGFAGQVDSRVDQSAFYSDGSPPDLGERFLQTHFGGSQFIQLMVETDLREPVHLRRIRRMGERIGRLQHVGQVQHIGLPVGLLNEAMEGQRRIPDSRAKVETLYGFLTGNPAVRQLANEERSRALMHISVNTTRAVEIESLLAEIEGLVAAETAFRVVTMDGAGAVLALRRDVAEHVRAVLREVSPSLTVEQALVALDAPPSPPSLREIARSVRAYLTGAEALVPLEEATAGHVARAVVALGPEPNGDDLIAAVATVLDRPSADLEVQDIAWSVGTPLEEAWAEKNASARKDAVVGALGLSGLDSGVSRSLSTALLDLNAADVGIDDPTAAAALSWTVSGVPVMHRGLSDSVTANQFRSLGFALGLVTLILSVAFRSIRAGLLASAPTAMAMLIIYGGMGAAGVHLDIGTSMLASLIIGAGVDYAVHLMSAWYAQDHETLDMAACRASVRVGPAIWTNALMVAVGFFVLTLGDARPLKNVGGLTAAAMIVAALVTFLLIPVLAGRRKYSLKCARDDPADRQLEDVDLLPSVTTTSTLG
jgi:predicted RND superfamily exporter protein